MSVMPPAQSESNCDGAESKNYQRCALINSTDRDIRCACGENKACDWLFPVNRSPYAKP